VTPRITVDVPADGTVRLRYSPTGDPPVRRSWALLPPVADTAENFLLGSRERPMEVVTEDAHVEIASDGAVRIVRRDGTLVADDGPGGGPRRVGPELAWRRQIAPGSHYYGFGERTGPLEKRGYRYTCWVTDAAKDHGPRTDTMHVAVPFRIEVDAAGRCSGLLVDTTWRSSIDLIGIDDGVEVVAAAGPDLTLVVLLGPGPDDVLRQYTTLTGRPALPPRWALGFHQSRWGYETADEIRTVARCLRERRIPADVVGIDIHHMDDGRIFTWSPEAFPDPAGLHRDLAALGLRSTVVVDCAVPLAPGDPTFDEGTDLDAFLRDDTGALVEGHVWAGRSVVPDFTRADVRAWWGARLHTLTDMGIGGVVVDMNEPSLRDRPIDDPAAEVVEVPPAVLHGAVDERATHAEVHNVYGALEAQAVAEGLRRLRPRERPFVMTRAGFAGVQRHAGVWTGDNASVWEHLRMSLPQLLNLGLSGVPFAGADIGGFFGHCEPELLVRWMQLGAWYPIMRCNNSLGSIPQEPWVWGPEVEDACRRAIERRIQFLPYLYTCASAAHASGVPVLRPLWWHHPTDPASRRRDDEAFVGPDLLIAPVLEPGTTARAVHLPPGTWFEWHAGVVHDGPVDTLVEARLDGDVPLFARAASIVPTDRPCASEVDADGRVLELHVFPDADGCANGTLYEDDGWSTDHERGLTRTTTFVWSDGVGASRAAGGFDPGECSFRWIVHDETAV
jgi:alpha-glucosidase